MAQKLYRGKKEREKFMILKEEMAKRAEMERASRERAKAKQQREEQERASRAVAGVNHLEIPAELAFIYSKLDGKCLPKCITQLLQDLENLQKSWNLDIFLQKPATVMEF